MKNNTNPYKHFDKYVLRSPLFSMGFYENLTSGKSISNQKLKKICSDPIIQEAIFIASPSLYFQIDKWLRGEVLDQKKTKKLQHSILKYLSRMSSRCTPFGLFSGCVVGDISTSKNPSLRLGNSHKHHTRLDMNYLVALAKDLEKNDKIRNQLVFFPNSSIYIVGDHCRYIEYSYHNTERRHHIVSVDNSKYLRSILQEAKKGLSIPELINILMNDDIDKDSAESFIEELVDGQLLISELEPSVTGKEFLTQIIDTLKKKNGISHIISVLEEVENMLKKLDSQLGNKIEAYLNLSDLLKTLGTDFKLKYLFQTDLKLDVLNNRLSHQYLEKICKGITFLNKISRLSGETSLSKFQELFNKRYESREIELSKAIDPEIGIGYLQHKDLDAISPLIDDLAISFAKQSNSTDNIVLSKFHRLMYEKLHQAQLKNQYEVELEDEEFEDFECNWDDLPDTLSSMVEVVILDGREMIFMPGLGGASGANLLGRFCHGDKELYNHVKSIVDVEMAINKDKLVAEIAHLPESRVGNILSRPRLRKYEIPYLANSSVKIKNQLTLDDLVLSSQDRSQIKIRSKKHNKFVLPRLTNAHNFSHNSLPIYNFLADMQLQGKRGGIGFHWGAFSKDFDFMPRVVYGDIIFSKALWNIKKSSIESFFKNRAVEEELIESFEVWRVPNRIPKLVTLVEGDNTLLINFNNESSIKMFLDTIKNKESFTLSEFLFAEDGIVNKSESYHTNQIVISFFRKDRLTKLSKK